MTMDANQQSFQQRLTRIETGKQWVPDGVIVPSKGKGVMAGLKRKRKPKRTGGKSLLFLLLVGLGLGLGAVAFPDSAPVRQVASGAFFKQTLASVSPSELISNMF